MRSSPCGQNGVRASALWGTGNRGGEHRSSALWGSNGRGGDHRSRKGVTTLVVVALALALPLAATAKSGKPAGAAYVAPAVYQAAQANPGGKIRVIIQSPAGLEGAKSANRGLGDLKRELGLVGAVAAEIPAARINALEKVPGIVVTLDAPVKPSNLVDPISSTTTTTTTTTTSTTETTQTVESTSETVDSTAETVDSTSETVEAAPTALPLFTSTQLWPYQNGIDSFWGTTIQAPPAAPTIAIVDSGIDANRADFDFGGRVLTRQVFTSLSQNPLLLDSRGHGTFVAGMAAGSAPGLAGAAPNANLVDLDVMDDSGMALTSDVIAAAQWIYENKDAYNIRVANFSLHAGRVLSLRWDPLNRAVEKLWFAGVVVVAASGNYGRPDRPSGVVHAPGNDPFVLTVGALDLNGTSTVDDDGVAPWSAYGYTLEGFAKPEVVAAGRYMVGPMPAGATLRTERPDNVLDELTMRLSGTSFSAPVVSGLAAQLLARNPSWTPDQVKGAIMVTTRPVPLAARLAAGRGQVDAAAAGSVTSPPNPNLGLRPFVVPAADGGYMFDTAAWHDAAWSDAAWSDAAWSDAAWSDAAWSDAAWSDAAWSDAAWSDAAWSDAAWSDAAWSDAAWSDTSDVD